MKLHYRDEEAAEAQWMHRIHVRYVHHSHTDMKIDDMIDSTLSLLEFTSWKTTIHLQHNQLNTINKSRKSIDFYARNETNFQL
jgi:hypothetical protein